MKKSDLLHLESRRRIYNYIIDNPGLHLHELARRLKITFNNLDYHINYLEKLGFISFKKENFYKRVYAKDKVSIFDKKYLNLIQQKTPRMILMVFCMRGACTQKHLSDMLCKHPTTISYHLKKLIDIGIVEEAKYKDGIIFLNRSDKRNLERRVSKNEIYYTLVDYDTMKNIFITYKKSLFRDKIFKFAFEYIEEVSSNYKNKMKTKNIKSAKFYNDNLFEVFFEIFPFPFCA